MIKKAVFLVMLIGMFNTSAFAWFSKNDLGTTGAQFLKLGVGARAIAMGEAFGAVSNDVSAVYWNPAGLAQIESKEVGFTHCSWFEGINHEYLAYAQPVNKGVLAASVNYLAVGDINRVDNSGNPLNTSYSPTDTMIALSYANKVYGTLIGFNLKYITSTLETEKATAYAFDAGVMRKYANEQLSLAIVVQNAGTSMKFINQEDPLPLNIKAASAYKIVLNNNYCIIALDVNAPRDNEARGNIGFEYVQKVTESISLSPRAGYNTASSSMEGMAGVSAGMGIQLNSYSFDYAWASKGDLGQASYLSFNMHF